MKKNYTISVPRKTFWFVLLPITIITVAVGSLLGVVIIDRVVMPTIVGVNKDQVVVPAITELETEVARQKLYDIGLRPRIHERRYDEVISKGFVISQNPLAGIKVKKDRTIDIIISKGTKITTVPEVVGLSLHQGQIKMRKLAILIGSTRKRYSDTRPALTIIGITPEEGTRISREIPITLFVSKGPKPTHTTVPNVIGESFGLGKTLIMDADLSIGTISYEKNDRLVPGTIISQSSSPGAQVSFETVIRLVVSVR